MTTSRTYQMPYGTVPVEAHCPGPRWLASRVEALLIRIIDAGHVRASAPEQLRSHPRLRWPVSLSVSLGGSVTLEHIADWDPVTDLYYGQHEDLSDAGRDRMIPVYRYTTPADGSRAVVLDRREPDGDWTTVMRFVDLEARSGVTVEYRVRPDRG